MQAAVDLFGPTDFLKMDEQLAESGMIPHDADSHSASDSPESLLLGRKITEIPDLVRSANPETYIHPNIPPCFIQHGTKDVTVPYQQSSNFAAKANAMQGSKKVTLELIPDALHADPRFESPENIKKVLDFLDQYLK